jgi:hypothetical protein
LVLVAVVVVARVVVVVRTVVVAGVVGAFTVVVVWRVVVVAAVVGGVVDDGTEGAAVVVVTPREERGRDAFVATVEFTAPVDRRGEPFPSGPIVTIKAVTSATAARVAPTLTNRLRVSEPLSVGDSRAIATG